MCLSALFLQERDAERRRQLRERARQLIAEARSGVKMSEMSLSDSSSPDRGRGGKTSLAGGTAVCSKHTHAYTHQGCNGTSYNKLLLAFLLDIKSPIIICLFESTVLQEGQASVSLAREAVAGHTHTRPDHDSHISIMFSKGGSV